MSRNTGKKDERKTSKNEQKEIKEDLIDLVKGHELIWLTSHVDHMNKTKITTAWLNILKELENRHGSKLAKANLDTVCKLKEAWKMLRDYYFRVRKGQSCPSGSGDVADPKWPFYKAMMFVAGSVSTLPTCSSLLPSPPSPTVKAIPSWNSYIFFQDDDVLSQAGDLRPELSPSFQQEVVRDFDQNLAEEQNGLQQPSLSDLPSTSNHHSSALPGQKRKSGPWTTEMERSIKKAKGGKGKERKTEEKKEDDFRSKFVEALDMLNAPEPEVDEAKAFSLLVLAYNRKMKSKTQRIFQKEVINLAIQMLDDDQDSSSEQFMTAHSSVKN